ncbi:DUF4148 domain-containing protein [Achromobacter xylosoxidans]|uniref:DUF4148 domain-containing protein n=1 Tax=Alcaligenes xylosoxydans xylosoxydans TaxID=85698 RepID=UPI0003323774|nr:DUF4148 domain-containing protein [Achromobacter xylosoxidans]CCH08360.1 hypothetical protein NH44784_044171 [Achromobacter xylosoxidans NH44784-1996]
MQILRKTALVLALAAGVSGTALAQQAPSTALTSPYGAPLTRAEVLADLALWKRAGVDRFWRGEATPDIYSPEYKAAFSEYVRLRSGPDYQAEVQRQTAARR